MNNMISFYVKRKAGYKVQNPAIVTLVCPF